MEQLTTARYLLRQVQRRRLELLAVRPKLNRQQLAEYRLTEKAIDELDKLLDSQQTVTLYAVNQPVNLPNIN